MTTLEHAWKLLDWEYVCDHSFEIRALYDQRDASEEYGLNWFEFIYTTEECYDLAQKWWKELPEKTQRFMLSKRLEELRDTAKEIEGIL